MACIRGKDTSGSAQTPISRSSIPMPGGPLATRRSSQGLAGARSPGGRLGGAPCTRMSEGGRPAPTTPANRYDALGPLAERARSLGLHVVAGRIEPVEGEQGHHVCLHMIDDSGVSAGIYRRTSPVGPYVYKDLDIWQVDYVD